MTSQQHYWFKAKRYGWGWTPANWKGWSALLIYVLVVCATGLLIKEHGMAIYLILMLLETLLLIWLCYKKGPKPKWQWGNDGN